MCIFVNVEQICIFINEWNERKLCLKMEVNGNINYDDGIECSWDIGLMQL